MHKLKTCHLLCKLLRTEAWRNIRIVKVDQFFQFVVKYIFLEH
jgi:hypothetical protein